MNFLDFLQGLTFEGETILVVRQKPTLVDGEMQYHADGAIKCAWPAMLPSEKSNKPGAWYVNTASFIESRFKSGRPSASAANCEHILFLMLDDVGTKSRIPQLEPTWKIETSPGNYQWGYAFEPDAQPKKGDFAAAIRAIAGAGYTDPGACNPVRNVRIPGSINIKPGRGDFAAVVTEFHPQRLFTLPQICAALGVTPGEADTSSIRAALVADDGGDDVFAWLGSQSLVISNPNAEGWAGIVCPNHAQHSDGNPEARYHPASRSFCCYHGHCGDIHSQEFLDWVAANGGPEHEHGTRSELLAKTLAPALMALGVDVEAGDHGQPGGMFSDAAGPRIERIEQQSRERIQRSEWPERYAYSAVDDSYFDCISRILLSRRAFNALHRAVDCRSINGGRKIEASNYYDEIRDAEAAPVLAGIMYAAGEPAVFSRNGELFGNIWIDAREPRPAAAIAEADIKPWLDHAAELIPSEDDRRQIFDAMAFKLQHPGIKINHAILHIGLPGAGKDTFWHPFLWAIGARNVSIVSTEELNSTFTYWKEAEVVVINELRQSEAKDRRALENHIKPLLAAPPETLVINRKGQHPYQILNRGFVLAFSNASAAINISSNDRRWAPYRSPAKAMDEQQARHLWRWMYSGGRAAVAGWLYARDVSGYNPAGRPQMSEDKKLLIAAGRTVAEEYLIELIGSREGDFAAGIIAGPWFALCDRLQGAAPLGAKIYPDALKHALEECGWVDRGRVMSRSHTAPRHVYIVGDLEALSNSQLRELLESPPQASTQHPPRAAMGGTVTPIRRPN